MLLLREGKTSRPVAPRKHPKAYQIFDVFKIAKKLKASDISKTTGIVDIQMSKKIMAFTQ